MNGGTLLNNVMQACKGDIGFSQTTYENTTLLNKLLFFFKTRSDHLKMIESPSVLGAGLGK